MNLTKAFLLTFFSLNTFASQSTIYFRKLIDSKDQSLILLACTSEQANSCRVLGGGAIPKPKVDQMKRKLLAFHEMQSAGVVAGAAAVVLINPILIFSFINVPASAITAVGATAYVFWKHKDFESYKKLELFANSNKVEISTADTIDAFDKEITELRK